MVNKNFNNYNYLIEQYYKLFYNIYKLNHIYKIK